MCIRDRLWIALAETEKELGLPITQEQIDELKAHAEDINYEVAEAREKVVRHDVMSHVYAYGEQCPKARAIIHLGATSCYVGDNTDVIVMTEALQLVRQKLVGVIRVLADFAMEYKDLPTLAFTHFQPAQPTTVGKRATLWIQDLMMDLEDVEYQLSKAKLLGSKGTTGTQASFLELFDGDYEKVKQLDQKIAEKMGYRACFAVSGQTYSRKLDSQILSILSGIAPVSYTHLDVYKRQMLRSAALDIITELGVEGGCNVQFALNPNSFEYCVIEVNPRVSRSSALASKATGYPIAKVASKIALGYTLDEIPNAITKKTYACFEPTLDYCVVKIPKWPFDKFQNAKRLLGTQMKATGEVMRCV